MSAKKPKSLVSRTGPRTLCADGETAYFFCSHVSRIFSAHALEPLAAVSYSGSYHEPKTPSSRHACILVCGRNIRSRVENESTPLAVSPEFNARLASRFPPGTADNALVRGLTAEGLKPAGSCESDPSVRILSFVDKNMIPNVTAQVYWHSDLSGRIAWTKGFVAYTFL